MLINLLVQTLQCAVTLILYLFCEWKHEKITIKVGYFRKIVEIFGTDSSD